MLFWHRLAIVGYTGVTGNERVEADLLRLKALMMGKLYDRVPPGVWKFVK